MSENLGGIYYEVDLETKGLIEESRKAKAELESLGNAAGAAAPGMEKLSKGAKQVASALAVPEVNRLSTQLAQLSGKLGVSSDAATEAAASQAKFHGVLGTVASKLGGGYVSNVGSATDALIRHAREALASADAQVKNAQAAKTEAEALQLITVQLISKATEERRAAESAVLTAEAELKAAEAVFERRQADIESLEALLTRQKESLKQSEANLKITNSEKAVAEAVRARNAVDITQNKIIRQSDAAIKEVTAAEDRLTAAKNASLTATQKLTQARALEVVALSTVEKANEAAALATEQLTVAAKAQALAIGGARAALSLFGGPAGILLLAAAGVYSLYQALNKDDDIEKFKQNISEAAKRVEYLDQVSARAAAAQTRITITADTKSLEEAKTDVAELKNRLSSAIRFNAPTDKINELRNSLAVAEGKANDLQRSIDKNEGVFGLFTQRIKDAGAATTEQANANELYDKTIKGVTDSNELLNNTLEKGLYAAQEMAAEKELRRTLAENGIAAEETERQVRKLKDAFAERSELTFEQELKSVQSNVEALRIEMTQGKEAAIAYRASIDATNKGYSADQVKEYVAAKQQEFKVTQQIAEQSKKNGASASSSKRDANAAESVAQKLANLKQQSELAADSTRELSREQAILNAQQSLGKGATQSQLELAGQYAAAKWDTANAIKAQAAAEKLLPEAKENASYKQDVQDLNTALAAKKISQEQYNETSERLEANHQANLAKIRAQQAVTPQQDTVGAVDPVQTTC